MVNRNAARHLLFVVSILLCFFIYMGYRLFGGGEETAAPPEETAAEFASSSGSPAPGSLRPGGAGASGLRPSPPPPPESVPLDDWASSGGDDFPELAAAPGSVIPPPPGGGIPFEDTASSSSGGLPFADIASSSSSSGPVAGMIPAPPSDARPAGMRPPTELFPPEMMMPGGGAVPAENPDGAAAVLSPPPFFASGSSPGSSGDEAVFSGDEVMSPPSSLPSPPFGGADASSPADGATEFAAAAPPRYETSSYASPEAGDYAYQDAVDEPPPFAGPSASSPSGPSSPVMRPPGAGPLSAPASASAASGSRPAAPAAVRETAPPPPVRSYDDGGYESGYDEYSSHDGTYSGEEEDALPGSESLRMYVVRTGDTLSNIAARELGSISLADNIFLLNRDVINDPDRLIAGVKIRLPVRDGSPAPGPGEAGDVVRRPTSGTGRVHTVARGDTLSSIAAEYYGTSSAWRFLYEANRNIVPDPNRLSVGTELTIPPYEETF